MRHNYKIFGLNILHLILVIVLTMLEEIIKVKCVHVYEKLLFSKSCDNLINRESEDL